MVITNWTGEDATHLQKALRMTQEQFAEYLGVATRTVATWRAERLRVTLSAGMQQILDTALERAPEPVLDRFARLMGAEPPPAPARPAPAAPAVDAVVAQMAADMALMQARIDQMQEQMGSMALRFLAGS